MTKAQYLRFLDPMQMQTLGDEFHALGDEDLTNPPVGIYGLDESSTTLKDRERITRTVFFRFLPRLAKAICNTLGPCLSFDIRFYGLLKTIGTTGRQIRAMIRLQALKLCILGLGDCFQISRDIPAVGKTDVQVPFACAHSNHPLVRGVYFRQILHGTDHHAPGGRLCPLRIQGSDSRTEGHLENPPFN